MSLVVVNVSAGSSVVTLPSISSVPGRILTVKDNGSASATNIATLTPAAGDTYESGVATYLLYTPFAYVTFIGNATTLKWRVLDSTYPDIPISIPPTPPTPGTLGGVTGSLTNLTVSGLTSLGNSSNTGNLGVAGITTLSGNATVSSNLLVSGLTTVGNVSASTINAYNINFTSSITSNGLPFTSGVSATSGFAQVTSLPIQSSRGICFDPSGNMYVNSSYSGTIYKITPQGVTSLLAGTYGVAGTNDGTGSGALFADSLQQMCYDSYTNCIVATNVTALRLISLTGVVTTIASGFSYITGVCSDGSGNFYVTELGLCVVKKVAITSVTPAANSGTVTTVAGTSGTGGYVNGTGLAAQFWNPYHIVINSTKTIAYIADANNHVIRQMTIPGYVVTTLAGAAAPTRTTGTTDSTTSTSVQFNYPLSMTIDANNNLYVGDYGNNSLRYINASPFYTMTLTGRDSTVNVAGVGANGKVYLPHAIALDIYGNPWVSTYFGSILNYNIQTGYLSIYYTPTTSLPRPANIQNTAISTLVTTGVATETIFGSGFTSLNSGVTYTYPSGILMDSQNNLYVADRYKIRKVTPSGFVTSIYGDPSNSQNTMQLGRGATGQLNNIFQMCFDTSGNMYIVGIGQNVIYKLNLTTYVATAVNITGQVLTTPVAILYVNSKLYITNRGAGSYVVMVDLSTNVSTLIAGSTSASGSANNATGTSATFNTITGSCFDATRNFMIVCDTSNNTLRTINLTSPYAVATLSFSGTLASPVYIAIDSQYNLYLSNYSSPLGLVKIPYTGSYTSPNQTYGTAASFPSSGGINYIEPQGVTIDSYNNIYITDATNRVIYTVTPSGTSSVYSGQAGVTGTQDSLYASSLTLLAPYVGIGKTNPQYPLDIGVVTNFNSNVNFSTNAQITTTSGFAQIAADQMSIDNSRGFCFDPSGNIYVNSSDRGLIYKINPQGVFSVLAGSYQYAYDLNIDGIGTNAIFTLISNMCYDSYTGCIVVGCFGTVRLVNPVTAQVTTIAGNYSASGSAITGNAVGTGKAAQFQWVYGVCTDNAGNFYVADNTYNNIKKVSISSPTPAANSGVVTMVAGSTSGTAASTKGYTNATGTSALFNDIQGITINSTKTALYVVEYTNNVVRQITLPGGVVTTVAGAGTGSTGVLSAGAAATTNSLTATSVQFNNPVGISIDANNNLFVGEYSGGFLRYVNLSPFYTLTLAGNGTGGGVSGVGTNSSVGGLMQISLDSYGNPWMVAIASFISQYNFKTGYLTAVYSPLTGTTRLAPYTLKNSALSTIAAPAITTGTLFGSGFTITNSNSTNPGGATYTYPNGVVVDSQNNVYVGDQYKIRRISPSGVVTSIYGDPSNTQNALFNGTGANAQTANVYGMCFDNSGNMYFTTTLNSSNYVVSNISRLNLTTYSVTPLILTGQTSISNPRGIVFDGSNTLYIACQNLTKSGYIVTVNINTGACVIIAGSLNGAQAESDNATGTSATFSNLLGICLDPAKQNIYSCSNSGSIRKISLTAPYPVTTPTITGFSTSGPKFIVCDSLGNLFVTLGTRVVKVIISTLVASVVNSITYGALEGIAIDAYNNLYVCDGTAKVVYIINAFGNTTGSPTNSSVYSGVVSSTGTQDSTYASSITLMAPYVGINTANPTSALHVNGNANIGVTNNQGAVLNIGGGAGGGGTGSNMCLSYLTGGYNHYIMSRHNSVDQGIYFYINNSAFGVSTAPGTGNAFIASITNTGIYTSFLEVGSSRTLSYGAGSFFAVGSAGQTIQATGAASQTLSITAPNFIFSGQGFIAASDERIKKNIVPVTDSLDVVNKLNLVSFDYIDIIQHKSAKHGLIAQQVKEVYPEAVIKTKDFIPSVFNLATSYEKTDDNVTITSSVPTGFSVKDNIRLYISDDTTYENEEKYETEVLEIISDTQFVVKAWDKYTTGKVVFIYGKKVDDFLSVDKPLIGLIAAGACKVLSGQVSTLQLESSQLSTITGEQFSTLQTESSQLSTITGEQFSTLQGDSLNTSTITGEQVSTLQGDYLNQQSTIAGLQATITTILEKYPV